MGRSHLLTMKNQLLLGPNLLNLRLNLCLLFYLLLPPFESCSKIKKKRENDFAFAADVDAVSALLLECKCLDSSQAPVESQSAVGKHWCRLSEKRRLLSRLSILTPRCFDGPKIFEVVRLEALLIPDL